jgi:hypothetical protein
LVSLSRPQPVRVRAGNDLVAAFADAEPVAVDDRVHHAPAVCEPCSEPGLVLALARFPLAPREVGEPQLLLLAARLLVAFRSFLE